MSLLIFLFTLLCTTTVCAETTVTTDEGLRGAIANGAIIRLDADIVLSTELVIDNNMNVTIDLNGHKLDRGLGTATDAATDGSCYILKPTRIQHIVRIAPRHSHLSPTSGMAVSAPSAV